MDGLVRQRASPISIQPDIGAGTRSELSPDLSAGSEALRCLLHSSPGRSGASDSRCRVCDRAGWSPSGDRNVAFCASRERPSPVAKAEASARLERAIACSPEEPSARVARGCCSCLIAKATGSSSRGSGSSHAPTSCLCYAAGAAGPAQWRFGGSSQRAPRRHHLGRPRSCDGSRGVP